MIGAASDRFAGMRVLAKCVRQYLLIIKKKKKSIPRARKQKCQTHPPRCRNSWDLSRYEAPLGQFLGLFAVILAPKRGPTCRSSLTFLTKLCQKRQTNPLEWSHQVSLLLPVHTRLRRPHERRTITSLNPLRRNPRHPVGSRLTCTPHRGFRSSVV
jgi:hypothetical protein